ncbi:hypothetical protein M6D81_05805 [Paenibacillus sp. J5C_2022]|uniref:hypothetical protein n=1 Tax=Paenibacillus sp. J5C2022 TaxID=2977129 RepID=UPI0021D2A30F|nr:hypothetical protein [Paenibacillus sp. J5C2022]MCU6708222.1 hypothetical protein [Paenibacillus sp. J5C2022]
MALIKNFILVVIHLVGELWMGCFRRSSDFYDKHAVTKTKAGYTLFVILTFIATIGIAALFYARINQ